MPKLDPFTRSYIETMLWESTGGPDGDTPLDRDYGVDDFHPDTLKRILADTAAFQEEASDWYDDPKQAGHDFWLTRVGAGAGFWDGDYPEPQATLLTNASKRFGHVDVVEGEYGVGPLYLEPSIAEARKHAKRLDPEAFQKSPSVGHATRRGGLATKKTPAQLDREIGQILAGKNAGRVHHATAKQLSAAEAALGYTPVARAVDRAEASYSSYTTNELRREIQSLEDDFEMSGGWSVDIAERLDAARIALSQRSVKPSGARKKVGHAVKRSSAAGTRIERKKLGSMMSPWGGDFAYGQGTGAIGAVSSYYYSDKKYPDRKWVERALQAIEEEIPKAEHGAHGWTKSDAKDLRKIASGLRYYLAHDYKE